MDYNHPVRQSYRLERAVERSMESAHEAGLSQYCIQSTLVIFFGILMLMIILI